MGLVRCSRWLLAGAVGALTTMVVAVPAARAAAVTAPAVWPLGDSITYGLSGGATLAGTTQQSQTPGGYRAALDSDLNQDGSIHQFVGTLTGNSTPVLTAEGQSGHDGHPGYRVDQITADLDGSAGGPTDDGGSWMTRASHPVVPDVAIVLIGGNDILQHYDPGAVFPTSTGQADYSDPAQVATFVSDLAGRLQGLITRIETLHPGTGIVLSDTTPIGTGAVDAVTPPYARAVQGVADQERAAGVTVDFVDIWSDFVESTPQGQMVVPGLIGSDGIHPTPAGYQVIANAFRAPLESLLSAG